MKPYSESCVQNQEPILNIIQPLLTDKKNILEIGSGTGQHAIYLAEKMPHLIWQTSDQSQYHSGIMQWLSEANLDNTRDPLVLNTSQSEWPDLTVDAVFSANTVHIMHWNDVVNLFSGVGQLLQEKGVFILYGPFNYNGKYTSESNARFDVWLKKQDPLSCIKHFEEVNALAKNAGLTLVSDYEMPANNRILYWKNT